MGSQFEIVMYVHKNILIILIEYVDADLILCSLCIFTYRKNSLVNYLYDYIYISNDEHSVIIIDNLCVIIKQRELLLYTFIYIYIYI